MSHKRTNTRSTRQRHLPKYNPQLRKQLYAQRFKRVAEAVLDGTVSHYDKVWFDKQMELPKNHRRFAKL